MACMLKTESPPPKCAFTKKKYRDKIAQLRTAGRLLMKRPMLLGLILT